MSNGSEKGASTWLSCMHIAMHEGAAFNSNQPLSFAIATNEMEHASTKGHKALIGLASKSLVSTVIMTSLITLHDHLFCSGAGAVNMLCIYNQCKTAATPT